MIKLGFLVQLANTSLWEEFRHYIDSIRRDIPRKRIRIDFYLHFVLDKTLDLANDIGQVRAIIEFVRSHYPDVTVTTSPNVGFDLGGFIKQLSVILTKGHKYDYLVKIHTKRNSKWRRRLINSICYPPSVLWENIRKMQVDGQLGMIGCSKYLFKRYDHSRKNAYHLKLLCQLLEIPYSFRNGCSFIAGTMFLVRSCSLSQLLDSAILSKLYHKLNTPTSLDVGWCQTRYLPLIFGHYGFSPHISLEQVHRHFERTGIGNLLALSNCEGEIPPKYRDGMIEHGLERLFGILVYHNGYKVNSSSVGKANDATDKRILLRNSLKGRKKKSPKLGPVWAVEL